MCVRPSFHCSKLHRFQGSWPRHWPAFRVWVDEAPPARGPRAPITAAAMRPLPGWRTRSHPRWHAAEERVEARPEPMEASSQAEPARTLPQLPDVVGIGFGEPQVAIRPRRDTNRPAARRRDRELADFAGERQSAVRRQGQQADEQAEQPAEQGETQGEVTRFHTHTKPFCLALPRPDRRNGLLSPRLKCTTFSSGSAG